MSEVETQYHTMPRRLLIRALAYAWFSGLVLGAAGGVFLGRWLF